MNFKLNDFLIITALFSLISGIVFWFMLSSWIYSAYEKGLESITFDFNAQKEMKWELIMFPFFTVLTLVGVISIIYLIYKQKILVI